MTIESLSLRRETQLKVPQMTTRFSQVFASAFPHTKELTYHR
jgi:hypothetical protein